MPDSEIERITVGQGSALGRVDFRAIRQLQTSQDWGCVLRMTSRTIVSSDVGFHQRWPCKRLRLAAATVQNPFGIAVRLRTALKDQVAGSLKGHTTKIRRHGLIGGITRILTVDDHGHAPQGLL